MQRPVFEPITLFIAKWCVIVCTFFISIPSLPAQNNSLADSSLLEVDTENLLNEFLTVFVRPDSVLKYNAISSGNIEIEKGPYGEAIVIGNNSKDALFLPGQSIDGLGDFTISFYVKLNGFNYHNNIISLANSNVSNEFIIAYNVLGDNLGMIITLRNFMYKFPNSEKVLSDKQWHHILITRSSSSAKLYVDGSEIGSVIPDSTTLIKVDTAGFVIGQDQDAIGGGFDMTQGLFGAIGGLKIFKYVLDSKAISSLEHKECPPADTACDDENPNTIHDREDGNCNCHGTPKLVDKKLQEVQLESEEQASQKRLLFLGLISLLFLGLGIFYVLSRKRQVEKEKLESQKEEEIQKRKIAESELALKQKELTAKILQLANKNNILLELETEMQQIADTDDVQVNKTSKRISKMIASDAQDEKIWDQFNKEFMVLHSSFMNKLVTEFGNFTKTEIRLISLLKMNLSSKDIMGILRISEAGLKKARYRLRKKLQLDSKIELQGFLLNYTN